MCRRYAPQPLPRACSGGIRGGMLCGHDYGARLDIRGHWGVKAAVDEFFDALNLPVAVMPHYVWYVMKPRSATP